MGQPQRKKKNYKGDKKNGNKFRLYHAVAIFNKFRNKISNNNFIETSITEVE